MKRSKHVQYCQSDTGRESYSRPDKLLRTVNILYDPSLFVSAVGGRVKRLLNLQHMPTVQQFVRSVQSVRIVSQFTTRQTVTDRKYTLRSLIWLRSVSIRQRSIGSRVKRLLNRQNIPTVRTVPYNPCGL